VGENGQIVSPINLPASVFTRHCAVFGASGSGKTGQILGMVEENIINGIPTILIDIKGDMSNIMLQDDLEMQAQIDFRLLTPGADHGEQINIFAGLSKPDRLSNSVSSLLKMIGENYDPIQSNMHAFLSKLLEWMHEKKHECNLENIIRFTLEPPFTSFGALELDAAVPQRRRMSLAAKLNTVLVAPSFTMWREGIILNVDELFARPDPSRTKVTVYSVAHLVDEGERNFAIALLLDEVLSWIRSQEGHDKLRACLVVDECVGIIPPYPANPPSKRPLMLLLKQARAFGLGLILASQNTKDLDYKALSNCETWLIGRLTMKRDQDRVIEGLLSNSSLPKSILEDRISSLKARYFLMVRPGEVCRIYSAEVSCELKGPMTPFELSKLYKSLYES